MGKLGRRTVQAWISGTLLIALRVEGHGREGRQLVTTVAFVGIVQGKHLVVKLFARLLACCGRQVGGLFGGCVGADQLEVPRAVVATLADGGRCTGGKGERDESQGKDFARHVWLFIYLVRFSSFYFGSFNSIE